MPNLKINGAEVEKLTFDRKIACLVAPRLCSGVLRQDIGGYRLTASATFKVGSKTRVQEITSNEKSK